MSEWTGQRFSIRFDSGYALLSRMLLLSPADSYVALEGDEVAVRMAWGFRARFPRAAVRGVRPLAERPISRGVHGFGGRWLVNGAGDGLVTIALAPAQRAWMMGFPIKLRELTVSLDDPGGLQRALAPRGGSDTPLCFSGGVPSLQR